MKRNTRISLLNRDGVRRKVNIEVGETGNHASGDLLDANATENLINDHISNLINLAPEALDTLGEVAEVLGSKVDSSSLSTVAFSGSYNDLENKPNIPTNISTFSNDAGYITPPEVIGVQAFPSSWPKSGTLDQLINAIDNDSNAVAGKAYLATVTYDDLPGSLRQAEIKAEINSVSSDGKVILLTVTSENVAPYHWERTSAYGRLGEWRSWSVATSGDTQNAASFNIDNWSITYATREAPLSEAIDVNGASHDATKIAVINIDQDPSNMSIAGDIGGNSCVPIVGVLTDIRDGSKVGRLKYNDVLKISEFYLGSTLMDNSEIGTFMKLPKFYFRCVQTGTSSIQIQFTMDSSLTDETWNIWNGNTFIGCYKATGVNNPLGSALGSAPGGGVLTNTSQSELKRLSRALGNGFSIVTYEAHQIMALLFYCFSGNTNCQYTIGKGRNYPSNYNNPAIPLSADNVDESGNIVYWGLCNWWGTLYEWVDNLVTLGKGYVGIQNYDGSIRRVVKTGAGAGMIQNMLFGQYVDVLPNFSGDQGCGCGCGCGCGEGSWNDFAVVEGLGSGYVARRSGAYFDDNSGVGYLCVDLLSSSTYSGYGSRLQYTGPYITIEN